MKTTIWMGFATLVLTWLWGGNLDLVPRPPIGFAIWLSDVYGATNGEDLGQLDLLYGLVVSFIVVAGCTLLARYMWAHRRR